MNFNRDAQNNMIKAYFKNFGEFSRATQEELKLTPIFVIVLPGPTWMIPWKRCVLCDIVLLTGCAHIWKLMKYMYSSKLSGTGTTDDRWHNQVKQRTGDWLLLQVFWIQSGWALGGGLQMSRQFRKSAIGGKETNLDQDN